MADAVIPDHVIERLQEELEAAQMWAEEFKRIARAVWAEDWESDDIDKLFDEWPTLPEWLQEQP